MKQKKTIAQLRKLADNGERVAEFVITSDRKDRHGTVLDIDGWILDSYHNNPVVSYQHSLYEDTNPDAVMGKSRVFRDGNQLVAEVTFEPADLNPLSDKVWRKIEFGTLRTASVGFLPITKGRYGKNDEARGGENETFYFGKRELLEFSIVNIPSNPDALKRQIEDAIQDDEVEEEVKNIEDNQTTDSVPDAERVRLLIELSKIV